MATETSSENSTSPDYDQIVNLVSMSCSGNNNGLPGDLVAEILCKLPVKSLIRFRTVCRPWKLLINSSVFVQNHLRSKSPKIVGFPVGNLSTISMSVHSSSSVTPFPFEIRCIVSAHNGLICFETSNEQNPLVLCNPSTREFSFLPGECKGHHYGFCYLSETQEYQIISCTQRSDNSCKMGMKIFTLGKSRFSRVKDIVLPGFIIDSRHATSGTNMFWFGFDAEQGYRLICYDLIGGRFSEINVPFRYEHPYFYMFGFARNIEDSVTMFVYPPGKTTSFETWTLIEDGTKDKSWIKHRQIEPPEKNGIIEPYHVNDQVGDYKVIGIYMDYVNHVESLVSINSLGIDSNYY